jgi:hypothetical protein
MNPKCANLCSAKVPTASTLHPAMVYLQVLTHRSESYVFLPMLALFIAVGYLFAASCVASASLRSCYQRNHEYL